MPAPVLLTIIYCLVALCVFAFVRISFLKSDINTNKDALKDSPYSFNTATPHDNSYVGYVILKNGTPVYIQGTKSYTVYRDKSRLMEEINSLEKAGGYKITKI